MDAELPAADKKTGKPAAVTALPNGLTPELGSDRFVQHPVHRPVIQEAV